MNQALSIERVNNAALDLEHIAELATSTAPTSTDRLGNVKKTLAGAIAAVDTVAAQTAAGQAALARNAAEAARDAALIQAGVYATEAAGRAAVADGQAFKVQGVGDVAAYEYRRTSSAASTLIAAYPSKAAYDAAISLLVSKAPAVPGKNLFNPADPGVLAGSFINGSTGDTAAATAFRTTGFISVTPGLKYAISHQRPLAWYDVNRAFISGNTISSGAPVVVTAPAGAVYLRTAVSDGNYPTFQIEQGAGSTAHEPFKLMLAAALPGGAVGTSQLQQKAVTVDKAAFFDVGKNLFDKAAAAIGFYVSHLDGAAYASGTYEASDYIPVVTGASYALSALAGGGIRFTCFFDQNKAFVTGGQSYSGATPTTTITAPVGAAYIRVSIFQTSHSAFQFEAGASVTDFEEYGIRLKPQYIPGAGASIPELVVPPFVYGVQGRECNVYLDNLHVSTAADYFHDVTGAANSGAQQNERWTWTPTGALAAGNLAVSVYDKRSGSLLVSKAMEQRAAASTAGAGLNKKVLVIGDSLIGAGVITQTLLDVAVTDAMGVTLLGTLGAGANRHEGRGGWSIANYTSDYTAAPFGANPFWINGAVNFGQYLTNNTIATPDWVFIHLGINDVFGQASDAAAAATADSAFAKLDTLVASIKAAGAAIRIGLMIPSPPSSDQDAFGASYGSAQTRWRHKRNIVIWARQLIAKYAGQEASRMYLVPTNTALDTVNNMQTSAAAPVNSRSAVTVTRQSNGVHPANSGYQQMGDALWAFVKFFANA